MRHDHRLGDDQRLQGSSAACLAIHQGPRLPRDDHPEGVWRPWLLRIRALAGHHAPLHALRHHGSDRDGPQLARARRAASALRHRGTEALLPSASGQGAGGAVLRADQSRGGLGRGGDSRLRVRLLGRARRPAHAGPARHVGQALHHAGSGRHAARSRVSRVRPGETPGRQGRPGHHVRADSRGASGRGNRPPPHAAQRSVPERPQFGEGCLHPDGLGHRRPADARPRLADADGMPGRGSRHFAAVVEHRHGDSRRARRRRLCARAHAVQDGDRQVRGHRGGARAHGRQSLHDGRDARGHRGRDRPGREAGRADGDREVPHHRARPPDHQRRHGCHRRQGHLHGTVEFPGRRLYAAPGRDHRRGREHPDAQPHHLRTGRDPLPPVRAEGNQGHAPHRFAGRLDRIRRRAVRPPALRHLELRAHAGHGLDRIAFRRACPRMSRPRRGAITSS